jgi:hypothetical protein
VLAQLGGIPLTDTRHLVDTSHMPLLSNRETEIRL